MEMNEALARFPTLGQGGLTTHGGIFNPERIELIRKVIRASIVPTAPKRGKWGIGSYGGKHYIEHLMDIYITNGEFILAMVMEGYETKHVIYDKPYRHATPNAVFRAKYKANSSIVHSKNWALRELHTRYRTAEVKAWEQVQDTVLMILFKVLYDAGRDPAKEPNLQQAVREIVGDH